MPATEKNLILSHVMTAEDPRAENEDLKARLEEALETLRAIRSGAVGAVVVGAVGARGVSMRDGADRAYRLWVEQMNQGGATLAPDGGVAYCNSRLATLLDTPCETMIGRSLRDHVAPDDHPLYDELLHQGRSMAGQAEFTLIRRDGSSIPVLLTLNPLPLESGAAVGVLVTDLTAQRHHDELAQAIAALQDSEERFRTLADNIPQLAWMTRPDGSIFWYNRRWYDYTGTTFEQMEGWGWQSIHDPDELPRVLAKFNEHLASGDPWEDTFPLRRHDGAMRWHLSRALAVRDDQGRVIMWFGTNTDITEHRQAEKERERLLKATEEARAEAESANRMKDEFLATLSHELRTPLNAIVGWTKILRSSQLDHEDRREGLDVIDRNAKAQAQLIDDLLDTSRIVTGKLLLDVQGVDLHEIIKGALEAVVPAAKVKEISIHTVLDTLVGPVSGDPTRLQQVIWNLLTNSVKFTPRGGKIQILLERVNSHVEISVIDTGKGIHPDFLPHVLERFRQADGSTTRSHSGLGLGLAIVKQLVEMHGGSVRVKSPGEGQGTTIVVGLPLMDVPRDRREKVRPRPPDLLDLNQFRGNDTLRGLRVLVVDDEPDSRLLIKRLLMDSGAEVLAAASAEEALTCLDAARPDILLSDIGMPDQDGYDLIRQVRNRLTAKELPAAALTAFARSEDRMRVMRAGFQVHVTKPVDPEELVAVVATLTARTGGDALALGGLNHQDDADGQRPD